MNTFKAQLSLKDHCGKNKQSGSMFDPRPGYAGYVFCAMSFAIAAFALDPVWADTLGASGEKASAFNFDGRVLQGYGAEVNADITQLGRLFGTPPDNRGQPSALTDSNQVGWLGIGMRLPAALPKQPDTNLDLQAIEVSSVMPDSAAEEAGLREGDLVVGLDGVPVVSENNDALRPFRMAIYKKHPGERVLLRVLRGEQVLELSATIKSYPRVKSVLKQHPDLEAKRHGGESSLLAGALAKEDLAGHFNRLSKVIRNEADKAVSLMVRREDYNPFRLREVNYVMYHPLDLPAVARSSITDPLSASFGAVHHDLSGLLQTAMDELDMTYAPESVDSKTPPVDFAGYVERLVSAIQHAGQERSEILSVLDADEINFLYRAIPGLLGSNLEQLEMEKKQAANVEDAVQKDERTRLEKQEFERQSLRLLQIVLKLDMQRLLNAAAEVATALDLETLEKLRAGAKKPERYPADWEVLEEENLTTIITPAGNVLIGGNQENTYVEDVALIIDLGGNDKYFNHAGGSTRLDPFSVVLDLSGDDIYSASDDFSQGAGLLGGGYLVDLEGNDRYTATNYSQGAGALGVGILADLSGRDQYTAIAASQGAAVFGAGLLAEGGGDDSYFGNRFVQGMGYIKGFGAIVEAGGNDNYFAGGLHEDFRAPGKSYQSLSQGFGYGIRPDSLVGASGGIGVIAEAEGNDTYVADYFAQGSSYWFALGILDDRKGNDRYIAGRYSQGAGIHSSAGVLIDGAGDDNYLADFGVSQGCGHDYGIGFLLDNGGDDRYIAGVIAQGAGNDNGIGVLSDNGGDDAYYLKKTGQGWGNFEPVSQEGSFGLLFDTGGGKDIYSEGGKNGALGYKDRWGLLLDAN